MSQMRRTTREKRYRLGSWILDILGYNEKKRKRYIHVNSIGVLLGEGGCRICTDPFFALRRNARTPPRIRRSNSIAPTATKIQAHGVKR